MKSVEDIHLYCFTPGAFVGAREPLEVIEAQIRGGADVIQLREKGMSKRERLELGFQVRKLTRTYDVLFIVNDDLDLALILDADGLHLGQEDIPIENARSFLKDKIIGISTHSIDQVQEAVSSGADYIGVGPIFETSTKKDRDPLVGTELLTLVRQVCPIPYVAIGGIKEDNIHLIVETGCNRAAIISDILLARNIEEKCRTIKAKLVNPY